jgi:hypothetical protein
MSKLTRTQQYYNPMLIDEADAIAPEIELKALISDLAPANVNFARIIVMAPKYLKELSVIRLTKMLCEPISCGKSSSHYLLTLTQIR